MYNFDPNNVLLAIATNIPVLLMTAFVLQEHICYLIVLPKMTNTVETFQILPNQIFISQTSMEETEEK